MVQLEPGRQLGPDCNSRRSALEVVAGLVATVFGSTVKVVGALVALFLLITTAMWYQQENAAHAARVAELVGQVGKLKTELAEERAKPWWKRLNIWW